MVSISNLLSGRDSQPPDGRASHQEWGRIISPSTDKGVRHKRRTEGGQRAWHPGAYILEPTQYVT